MLQMYHAVMRFSLNKSEQAHVSSKRSANSSGSVAGMQEDFDSPESGNRGLLRGCVAHACGVLMHEELSRHTLSEL